MDTTESITIQVEGVAETKDGAFANALSKIQKTLTEKHKQIILRIQPTKVQVVKAEKKLYKEKFLLFFFPRTRQNYCLTLDVTVDVTMFDVEAINFKEV